MANTLGATKSEIVKNYFKEWGHLANRTLARKICEEHPATFTNVEDARRIIRHYKGEDGKSKRRSCTDKTFYTEEAKFKLTLEDIEEGIDEQEPPFIFPKNLRNMLILSDLHIPYHNATAVKESLKYGKENQCDSILLNGDIIDFAPCSEYTKDAYTKMRMSQDIEETRMFLQIVRNEFPDAPIYYKMGNHCFVDGTEVLTDKGFVDFKDVKESDLLAQFDCHTKQISFSAPERLISQNYSGKVVDIESNYSRQIVTENHNVVLGVAKKLAKDVTIEDINFIPNSGEIHNVELPYSDNYLKLLVNVVCDGSIVKDKKYPKTKVRIQFKLSKQRKIDNLVKILTELNVQYTIQKATMSSLNKLQPFMIRIYGKHAIEIIDALDDKKEFPLWFKSLSKRQVELVVNEISITDGTNDKYNGINWTSTTKNDIDLIQEICISNSISFNFVVEPAGVSKQGLNKKTLYRARIRIVHHYAVNKSIKEHEYNGMVYCATMPKGTLITRYEGKTGFSGNCDWYEKYLQKHAPVLLDMNEFKLEVILRLKEMNIIPISSYALMKFGKLSIVHGHEMKQTLRSVNPARTLYLKTKLSTLVSHHHVTSEHTEGDIEGNITTCWSIGCLSQLKPKYAGLDSKYNHGFARVTKTEDGNFSVHNKRIVKGNIV
jgi:hypothetical protein